MNRSGSRRGIAATEFAVCLPVIVLIVLATVEACTMVFLKQALTVAAYEGARVAIAQDSASSDVQQKAEQILAERRINGGAVSVRPNNLSAISPGEYLSVTVTAPAAKNSVVPITFYRGRSLSATASMMKEF